MKNSFVLFHEFKESVELLSDEQAGKLFKALFDYETEQTEPEFTDVAMKIVFSTIRNSLDRNKEKYEKRCKRNKENGLKGGRPKKAKETEENPNKPIGLFENPQKADSDSERDSDSDSVSDSVCDSERDSGSDCVSESVYVCDNVFPSASQKNIHITNHNKINQSDIKSPKDNNTFTLGKFFNVTLTFDELVSLKDKFPASWERRIDELSSYMESSGKTYNNCYAKLLEWKFFDKGKTEEELQKDNEREKKKDEAFRMTEDRPSYNMDMWNKKCLSLMNGG